MVEEKNLAQTGGKAEKPFALVSAKMAKSPQLMMDGPSGDKLVMSLGTGNTVSRMV